MANSRVFNRFFGIFLLLCVLFPFSANAAADFNDSYIDKSLHKLGRGIHDTLFCFGELPYQMSRTHEVHGVLGAATVGVVKGVGRTIGRLVVGVFEIGTFYWPQEPILEPEFFFEDF